MISLIQAAKLSICFNFIATRNNSLYMANSKFDSGFSKKPGRLERMINKDGSFNVTKLGTKFSVRDLFQYFINLRWFQFNLLVIGFYFVINILFALVYWLFDCSIVGSDPETHGFLTSFFFSVQTFTTLGYGTLSPGDITTNLLASFESFAGLLSFALATGLLYGKFSKPRARIRFSQIALIRPFKEGQALMFRLANERTNVLTNMHARVIASYFDKETGKRGFKELSLETSEILYFPLNWTVVHEIKEDSPFYGLSHEEIIDQNFELLITIKGYDDSYSADVRVQSSYTADEFTFGKTFIPTFHYNEEGQIIMDIDKLDAIEV